MHHGTCVKIRRQSRRLLLTFHVLLEFFFDTCHPVLQAGWLTSFHGFSCLPLSSHHNAGITAVHYHVLLSVGSGELNSGLHFASREHYPLSCPPSPIFKHFSPRFNMRLTICMHVGAPTGLPRPPPNGERKALLPLGSLVSSGVLPANSLLTCFQKFN